MFTIADASTKPYAHMVENIDPKDITDPAEFVESWARTAINATNYGEQSDEQVYQDWRETGEFEVAVRYITEAMQSLE